MQQAITLDLHPLLFQPAYNLYLYLLTKENVRWVYIGMTGDNHYPVARPAIRRLAGHFDLTARSTQNQLVKGFYNRIIGGNWKVDVNTATPAKLAAIRHSILTSMSTWNIIHKVYHVMPFEPELAEANQHFVIAGQVRELEAEAIRLANLTSVNLFNRIPAPLTDDTFPSYPFEWNWILDDIGTLLDATLTQFSESS